MIYFTFTRDFDAVARTAFGTYREKNPDRQRITVTFLIGTLL